MPGCGHQVEPDPAQRAKRHGLDTPVMDWRERLLQVREVDPVAIEDQAPGGGVPQPVPPTIGATRLSLGSPRISTEDGRGGSFVTLHHRGELERLFGNFRGFQ